MFTVAPPAISGTAPAGNAEARTNKPKETPPNKARTKFFGTLKPNLDPTAPR
jgi:hypothetical protein